jgi:hypothetical protein
MRALAWASFLACLACRSAAIPDTRAAPQAAARSSPAARIALVARLVAGSERESYLDPDEWGPYVRARRLHASDPAAQEELEHAFPGCSLSAFELDTCGTIPGDARRFTLGLSEARTRTPLARTEVRVGDEKLRLLVSVGLGLDQGVHFVESFSVYRIDPDGLEPLFTARASDKSGRARKDVVPLGLWNSSGWHNLFLNFRRQVIYCWCLPDPMLEGIAANLYESGSTGMYMLPGVERPELLKQPLASWPEPVWVLTLKPAGP